MAGTIQPIAALTVDDHGSINTIFAIVLPVTSGLVAIVRISMRQRKFHEYESEDVVFGVGFCFGILTSILSYFCVREGLGRHQITLNEEQVSRYFELFWITQIMGVIALALAKLSLVLLFKRITPKQMGPRAVVWLLPIVAIYTILSLALIAFQCQLPQPWILSPSRCSTHGNVYYPITISNMLTDALLAIWMLPIIRALHMKTHPKAVVMWLFGSRLIICVADIGRMVVIHRALQSEDQTRSQLLWAIMDQVVVHLSINHATLPRIQNFLSNLQIGSISVHMPASQSGMQTATARSDQPKKRRSTGDKVEPTSHRAWNALRSHLTGTVSRKSSISEQPLRHEEDQGIELSTIVYTGKGGLEQRTGEHGRSAATSLSSDGLDRRGTRDQQGGVRVQKDVSVTYEHV